ncbi:MAG: DNA polymerase III subunit gamma/tau [Erysipelotrichaceae bacterium]
MAYKALYRTYRPTTFEQVAGQQVIVKTLKNAIQQNKIAHAYLFCGPRGTGKTSIAKIFAKAINCTGSIAPCGSCANCKALEQNNHPDVIEIDAASNNGVDEVRELIEKVKYAPIEAKYKVYIIDEVHMMTTGAFNALLKTIEEPPAHVIFILATTEPHKVLPTILSRCQRFDFGKVEDFEIVRKLAEILGKEDKQYEEGTLELIATLADGGMRDALSILDQCLAYVEHTLTLEAIYDVYGIVNLDQKVQLLHDSFSGSGIEVMESIAAFANSGIDIKRLTADFVSILKDTIVYDLTKASHLMQMLRPEHVDRLIKVSSNAKRIEVVELLMDTMQKYQYSSNVLSYFEIAMLKILELGKVKTTPDRNVAEIRENVSRETSSHNEADTAVIESAATPSQPKPPAVIPVVHDAYEDHFILQLLVSGNRAIREEYMQAHSHIKRVENEMKWARYAKLLLMMDILASNEQFILFKAKNSILAKQANEIAGQQSSQELIVEIFGSALHVFAVSEDQANRVVTSFIQRRNDGSLPEPMILEPLTLNAKDIVEKTEKERVIELFGEEQVIIQ